MVVVVEEARGGMTEITTVTEVTEATEVIVEVAEGGQEEIRMRIKGREEGIMMTRVEITREEATGEVTARDLYYCGAWFNIKSTALLYRLCLRPF